MNLDHPDDFEANDRRHDEEQMLRDESILRHVADLLTSTGHRNAEGASLSLSVTGANTVLAEIVDAAGEMWHCTITAKRIGNVSDADPPEYYDDYPDYWDH